MGWCTCKRDRDSSVNGNGCYMISTNINVRYKLLKERQSHDISAGNVIAILIFLSFVLIGSNENAQGDIYVFFINFNKTYVLVVLLFLGLLISTKCNIAFDNISLYLVFRFAAVVLSSIILILSNQFQTEYQLGILMAFVVCVIAYLLGQKIEKSFIAKVLFCCMVVICMQLIVTYIGRRLSFGNIVEIKWWMRIPFGQTNTVGCLVVGMMAYIVSSNIKKVIKLLSLVIAFICIVFTVSRSGFLIYCLYCFYIFIKWTSHLRMRTLVRGLFFCVALISIIIYFWSESNLFERFNFDSLTSSRLQVYKEGIELFLKYPLTGVSAFKFHIYDAVKAHNWILESLIESGIVGSIFYFYAIYLVYKSVKKKNKAYVSFIVIYLLHGMVEPNLFTVGLDTFFWLLVGTLQTEDKRSDEKTLGNNSNLSKN